MYLIFLIYAGIGIAAGILAGLLGIGGGIIIIPSLVYVFSAYAVVPHDALMQYVVGTSLAAIITTTVFSLYAQYHRGTLSWPLFYKLVPGIIVGTVAGAFLARILDTHVLKISFGLFMMFVSLQTFFGIQATKHQELPGRINRSLASLAIGVVSGLLGISGGALTIPYLTYYNVPIRQAMAASTSCGIVISFTGMISFIILGWHQPGAPAWSSGYVYWPAVLIIALCSPWFVGLGSALSGRLPVVGLRRIFGIFIFLVGLEMLVE